MANELNMSYRHSGPVSYDKTRRQYEVGAESDQQNDERSEQEGRKVLFRTTAHDALETRRDNHSLFQRRSDSNDRQTSDVDSGFEDEKDSEMDIENENEYVNCGH